MNPEDIVDIKNSSSTRIDAFPLSQFSEINRSEGPGGKKLREKVMSADPRGEQAARARKADVGKG